MSISLKADAGGTSGAIQINGVDAVVISSSGITQGAPFSFRNKIINGDFSVNQRGTYTLTNGIYTYTADRWLINPSGASPVAAYNTALVAPDFSCGVVVTGTAGLTAVQYGQRIEAANSKMLAGKTVSIQLWAYQSTGSTQTLNSALYRANSTDNFGGLTLDANFTLNSTSLPSGVWTKFTGTATLSGSATTGLYLVINFSGTLTSGNIAITGVQLEAGSVATPFEHRPYQVELAMCQRYYQYPPSGWSGAGVVNATTTTSTLFTNLLQQMRAAPTVTWVSGGATDGISSLSATSVAINAATETWFRYTPTTATSQGTFGYCVIGRNFMIKADAEL